MVILHKNLSYMSDLNTRATVTLSVNGQQAEKTLQLLKQNALDLETAIAKAASAGNKADLKRLRRELASTKRQIREIESASMQVDNVLRRLDKATPKELSRSLATLNRQLEYMERGSSAWNSHIEKIKRVKAEIKKVNEEVRDQEGFWGRFNRTVNDWQTTIMGAAAAVTGIVMAGRAAVSAYADMEAEMANVRKYTGMTAEEVEQLNDVLRGLNTRTSREELNRLAQDAGRLGKSSMEDVVGFVRAADQLNVALNDLGDGATLVLSKLTSIFGDEDRLGTEKALLAVGSVINELSQNCTASAPYLAEFAQRMAGVGAQAKMTIPQIMGFAAVLDSQGQAVEMSATALSKLIMNLFKEQDKIVKATGMNAEKFNEALKRSTNEGLIMLIERLHELGNIDVLAPVFKDMGENGARASQVMAALAANIDTVKWQQGEAAKAYREATSVTKEFEVQNNTVQAGLEKARKGVTELAVELGEKLLPIMQYVVSSTTLLLRAMSITVDFIKSNWTEIRNATIMLAAYTIGVNAHVIATSVASKVTLAWNGVIAMVSGTMKGYTTAMVFAKDAVIGCSVANQRLYRHMLAQNVVTKLVSASTLLLRSAYFACTFQISALRASLKSLYVVMAANPYGLILAGLAAVGTAIYTNIQRKKEQKRLEEEERQRQKELFKDYDDHKAKIALLSKVLHDNNRDLKDRKAALDELKSIVPGYHADLDSEGNLIKDNTVALDEYLAKLRESIVMKANRDKLEGLYKKQDELAGTVKSKGDEYWNTRHMNTLQGYDRNSLSAKMSRMFGMERESNLKKELDTAQKELASVNAQITELEKKVVPVSVSGSPSVVDKSPVALPGNTDTSGGKFDAEDDWRKREDALNRISYAKGEKDYIAYRDRMLAIEQEYHKKKLEHTDLTESERLQIEAEYHEAGRKIADTEHRKSIDEVKAQYNEDLALLKQRYIDGKMTLSVYEEASEQLEMEHLRKLSLMYESGSKDRLDTEKALQDKLLANQKRHQSEYEASMKKHTEALARMKERFFGDNPAERQTKYAADLALLQEVYNAEIIAAEDNAKEKLRIEKAFQKAKLALMEEYNIEGAEQNMSFLESWNEEVMDFLESDFGQSISGSLDTLVSGMSSLFQQLTSIIQAELEIQQAEIDRRYDAEISLAEGNNYKISKLEKQREAEQAKAKKEANKKMFAMQVIQAVAQTAVAALNAYSSAAAIPVVGFIMAPIAAAMAVAAGALQIAAIKKQQQASEAQGYMLGGFTPEGREDEVRGVVHAGEWVASQKLTHNPKTRPILEALDYAQRTNTVGSLSSSDVSSSITAPKVMASVASSTPQKIIVENRTESGSTVASLEKYTETIRLLHQRLNEPFITVNSVTGDVGMQKAQEEYDRLIRNKTPKSRR